MLSSALYLLAATSRAAPALPKFDEQFQLNLVEVDDDTGNETLRQTLAVDKYAHRSHMTADGLAIGGHLEQIRRCDIVPTGFFIQVEGGSDQPQSEWTCTNTTVDSDPASCQWNNFWDIPANSSYTGSKVVNGLKCSVWSYWDSNIQYEIYADAMTGTVPVRLRKISKLVPTHPLWHLDFFNYTRGAPPMPAFAAPQGTKCPPASPPLGVRNARTLRDLVREINHRH